MNELHNNKNESKIFDHLIPLLSSTMKIVPFTLSHNRMMDNAIAAAATITLLMLIMPNTDTHNRFTLGNSRN